MSYTFGLNELEEGLEMVMGEDPGGKRGWGPCHAMRVSGYSWRWSQRGGGFCYLLWA